VADLGQHLPADNLGRAEHLRRLVADLLANGERRVRDQQYEEAVLRAYRIVELLGEARLFARGVDVIGQRLNRHGVLDELDRRRDPLAKELRRQARLGTVQAVDRHESILAHGYEPVGGSSAGPLRELYQTLEGLILRDGRADGEARLGLARSMPSAQAGTPLALLLPG
jgi:hypothetical protein